MKNTGGIILQIMRTQLNVKETQNGSFRYMVLFLIIKGIFSDSNNIFLWHESEDINDKSLFPKFQLFPILRFQVMHDYVCFIAPIDYCVE